MTVRENFLTKTKRPQKLLATMFRKQKCLFSENILFSVYLVKNIILIKKKGRGTTSSSYVAPRTIFNIIL